jgi:hypothetical protein
MPRRRLAWLVALLPALAGCLHHDRPVLRVNGCEWRPVDEFPDDSKGLVYIFLLDEGGRELAPVREYLHQLGFRRTYAGTPSQASELMLEMGVAHVEQPTARFAVIGYGSGADAARRLAAFGARMHIPVDLFVVLEPTTPEPPGPIVPDRVTFTIRGQELSCPAGSRSPCPGPVEKAAVPTHAFTLGLLERELTLVTMAVVPPRRPLPKRVHLVTPIPPPRETTPRPKPLPIDWQFLRLGYPWDPPTPRQRPDIETLPMPRVVPELPDPKPAS